MLAHIRFRKGKPYFSGYNACGDLFDGVGIRKSREMEPIPYDAIIDVGKEFIVDFKGEVYITEPGLLQFCSWTPLELIFDACKEAFGFRLVQ